MGFQLSPFLIREQEAQDFLRIAGLCETDCDDEQSEARHPVAYPDGDCLVCRNWHADMPMQTTVAGRAGHLSYLALDLSENTMTTDWRQWRAGREVWALSHDGREMDGTGALTDDLPAEADAIIAAARDRQAGESGPVDHLPDAPEDQFTAPGGIRHDAMRGLAFHEAVMHRPAAVAESRRPWWRL